MHVLYVLSCMIERVGYDIKPYVGALTSYLSTLWQQSENHHMLRCAIVTTLVHLEKVNENYEFFYDHKKRGDPTYYIYSHVKTYLIERMFFFFSSSFVYFFTVDRFGQ